MPAIRHIETYAIVQNKPDYSWSPVMPDVLNTDTIIRLIDENGVEGVSSVCTFTEYGVDKSVLESVRPLAFNLLRESEPDAISFWDKMQHRRPGVTNSAIAAIDIALWDLQARRANLPLHKLLGGQKSDIAAYASVPILETPQAYIDLISELRQTGFNCFKIHYKSQAKPDAALIKAVGDALGNECDFMFDAENLYDEATAADIATLMANYNFIWLEAPFNDHDWAAYHALKTKEICPILPAGNSVVDVAHIRQAISANCWDAIRIDAATAGGITPSLEIFKLAQQAGLTVECQSWGSSLSTAANLHLALAHDNSQYFEMPVPRGDFILPGCCDFALSDASTLKAPTSAGSGLEMNWDALADAASAIMHYDADTQHIIKA